MIRVLAWFPILSTLFVLGCGPTGQQQEQQVGPPPPPPPPPPAFTGQLDGQAFSSTFAFVGWRWPNDYRLFVADRRPGQGGEFPPDATVLAVRLSSGRALEPNAPNGADAGPVELTSARLGTGAPAYSGMAAAQFLISSIDVMPDNPSAPYPQKVGIVDIALRAMLPADGPYGPGQIDGRTTVDVVFLEAPHEACRELTPAASDVTWAEAPQLTAVPAGPVRGNARGHGFSPRSIYFEKTVREGAPEEWRLVLTTAQIDGLFPSIGAETLNVTLARAPRRGRQNRALATGGGHFQVCSGLGTTSWNAENAYELSLTAWTPAPCTPDGPGGVGRIGTASGRVFVVYKGFGEDENTWVAGDFADVPVLTARCE